MIVHCSQHNLNRLTQPATLGAGQLLAHTHEHAMASVVPRGNNRAGASHASRPRACGDNDEFVTFLSAMTDSDYERRWYSKTNGVRNAPLTAWV